MAHHQAMSFLALNNYICGKAMRRRFHADPRVLATGGLAPLMIDVAETIDSVEPDLTLEGLRLIHEKGKGDGGDER